MKNALFTIVIAVLSAIPLCAQSPESPVSVSTDTREAVYESRNAADLAPLPLSPEFRDIFDPPPSARSIFSRSDRDSLLAFAARSRRADKLTPPQIEMLAAFTFPLDSLPAPGFFQYRPKETSRAMITDNGTVVIRVVAESAEVSAGLALTEKHTCLTQKALQKINRKITSDPVRIERLKIGGIEYKNLTLNTGNCSPPENADMQLGQDLIKDHRLIIDDQYFNARIEPGKNRAHHNLVYCEFPVVRGHDGDGTPLLFALDMNREKSVFYDGRSGSFTFYIDDIAIEFPDAERKVPDQSRIFEISGILGADIFRGRKISMDFSTGHFEVFERVKHLDNGIYLVAGTVNREGKINTELVNSAIIEVVPYAEDFIPLGAADKNSGVVIFTPEYVPAELSSEPAEVESPGGLNAVELSFTGDFTRRFREFSSRHEGENIALIIGGKVVTMQSLHSPTDLENVKISKCSPRAVEYLYLHLRGDVKH